MKPCTAPSHWPIEIGNLNDLERLTPYILEQIRHTPHGGVLYSLHPLMFMEDIGFRLSHELVRQLQEQWPDLVDPDGVRRSLPESSTLAGLHVEIKDLFNNQSSGGASAFPN